MDSLTVVIPTYNRAKVLRKALLGYKAQSDPGQITELIVVDDGSTDDTDSVVRLAGEGSPFPVRYLRQSNKGPAAARNVGIREARGRLILFTDDDIIPTPTLVAEHLAWHAAQPGLAEAILGYVTWAPEINATPFMVWYGSDGPLFAYGHFKDCREVGFSYFYTCNLSLKVEFLRENGTFDEEFPTAAYEDVELGYRLDKRGMRLFYNSEALAYHHQYVSFEDACNRAKKAALAREVLLRKEAGRLYASAPKLKRKIVRKAVRWVAPLLSPLKVFMDKTVPLPWGVYRVMFRVFGG
jgi:glycosyltransferase involved in cell wall biosynthesis